MRTARCSVLQKCKVEMFFDFWKIRLNLIFRNMQISPTNLLAAPLDFSHVLKRHCTPIFVYSLQIVGVLKVLLKKLISLYYLYPIFLKAPTLKTRKKSVANPVNFSKKSTHPNFKMKRKMTKHIWKRWIPKFHFWDCGVTLGEFNLPPPPNHVPQLSLERVIKVLSFKIERN